MSTISSRILKNATAAALSIALCGVAAAQQSDTNTRSNAAFGAERQSTKQRAATQKDGAPAIVIGEVRDMRNVQIKGPNPSSHRLMKVATRGGDTVLVDLGAADESSLRGLAQGDRVLAVGKPGRINDRPVIVARSVGELYAAGDTGAKRSPQATRDNSR